MYTVSGCFQLAWMRAMNNAGNKSVRAGHSNEQRKASESHVRGCLSQSGGPGWSERGTTSRPSRGCSSGSSHRPLSSSCLCNLPFSPRSVYIVSSLSLFLEAQHDGPSQRPLELRPRAAHAGKDQLICHHKRPQIKGTVVPLHW